MIKAVLGLEDGTIVKGTGFGAECIVKGELVFTTQCIGYEEALTDPSYKGQVLMFTYPPIGNYGVSGECFGSEGIKAEGLVLGELCNEPSHHRSKMSLSKYMEDEGKPGISGIDTRMLTIKSRDHGTMRAALINGSDNGDEAVQLAREMPRISERDLISKVTCAQPFRLESPSRDPNRPINVVLVDFGRMNNIEKTLLARGMDVTVVPAGSSADTISSYSPDILFLSNGPGDPRCAKDGIKAVKELTGQCPVVGIGLGHQIISLALGGETYKLKVGHRGANQPVKDLITGAVYITSQNYGFAVDPDSLEGTGLHVTQVNMNDGTVEGISHKEMDIFGVQYYPEAIDPMGTGNSFYDKVSKLAGRV